MELAIPGISETRRFTDRLSLSVLAGPILVAEDDEAVLRSLDAVPRFGTGSLLLVFTESRRAGRREPVGGLEADTVVRVCNRLSVGFSVGSGLFPVVDWPVSEGSRESIDWMVSVIS